MNKGYRVTQPFLKTIAATIDFDALQSARMPKTFNHDNKCFIPVMSSSNAIDGYTTVSCHEVIPFSKYEGKDKPATFWEHRKRGYHALLLKSGSDKFVMIDPMIDFKPVPQEKQLEIF